MLLGLPVSVLGGGRWLFDAVVAVTGVFFTACYSVRF
jgi:hypothetical protein